MQEKDVSGEKTGIEKDRSKVIAETGYLSIGLNLVLAVVKGAIGMATSSVSIISDAVNNLTDCISSCLTVIGIKLASRKPTSSHPLGYGRFEYLTTLTIGILILITGYEFLKSSIIRIIHPQLTSVSTLQIGIIFFSIFLKIVMWKIDVTRGKAYHSDALIASGSDALNDCFATALTVLAAVCAHFFKIDIDGWAGLIISVIILFTGIDGIKNATNSLLGGAVNHDTAEKITEILLAHPPIVGVYHLVLYNIGPEHTTGSVVVEIPGELQVEEAYQAIEAARRALYRELKLDICIGIEAVSSDTDKNTTNYQKVLSLLADFKDVTAVHGFYENSELMRLRVVISYQTADPIALEREIRKALEPMLNGRKLDLELYYTDVSQK